MSRPNMLPVMLVVMLAVGIAARSQPLYDSEANRG